jgi:hypothetical protein
MAQAFPKIGLPPDRLEVIVAYAQSQRVGILFDKNVPVHLRHLW